MNIVKTKDRTELEFIHQSLYSYNLSKTGDERQDVVLEPDVDYTGFVIKSETFASPLGGIVFHLEPDHLYIDLLWISETLRKSGAGTELIELVKKETVLLKREVIRLFTVSFQAPAFYAKMGFTLTRETTDEKDPSRHIYHYEYVVS